MNPWFLLFLASIGAGGFFALLIAVARTPVLSSLIPQNLFYHWLVGHVDLTLIIGLLSFLAFLWSEKFKTEEKFYRLLLAYGGALGVFLSALLGFGKPVDNNYVPTLHHPLFFISMALFFLGYTLRSLSLTKASIKNILSPEPLKSTLSASILLSLLLSLSALLSFIRSEPSKELYLYFESVYWLPGHTHQFINACLLLSSWITLASLGDLRVPRYFSYLPLFLLPFPVLYLLLLFYGSDPLSPLVKTLTTLGYGIGIGVPTVVAALYFMKGLGGNYWGKVLALSAGVYLIGAGMGYLIAGSDLRIPAHYHGVIASILISIMALTYYYLRVSLSSVVKVQPFLYGVGMLLFVLGLFWSGVWGSPRKTPGTGYIESVEVYLFMLLMGLGAILSVLGGIMFIAVVLSSIIKGWRRGKSETGGQA